MRLALLLSLAIAGCATPPPVAGARCVAPGAWVDDAGRPIDAARLMRRDAGAAVVALGESHASAEDHRWQLQALVGLHAVNPRLAVGMEMFPRRLQPVLDRWTAGELDEADFLRLAEWDRVWGFDAQFYLPLLHFARMNHLPLIALNVDRSLTARVARQGWAAVPPADRQGVGDPAPVTSAYRRRLAEIAAAHGGGSGDGAAFERFVAAQSLWDRAMAEAAAAAHRRDGRTVALILGRGHVQYRDGVIHQLAALGVADARVWLPWRPDEPCNGPDGVAADALFGVTDAGEPKPAAPRLGGSE